MDLESHNLVQNIPHKSTNGGPSTTSNVDSRSKEIPFPFIYLFFYIFHNWWTSKARARVCVYVCGWVGGGGGGGEGVRMHPSHLPPPYGPVYIHA